MSQIKLISFFFAMLVLYQLLVFCREFLEPGAPCEINIDGKTMEKVQLGLKNPSRFAFDAAAEHIYTLLLKKDCYPRFVRSEHYKNLMANAIQPSLKKRFFGFGGGAKKKGSTSTAPNPSMLTQVCVCSVHCCAVESSLTCLPVRFLPSAIHRTVWVGQREQPVQATWQRPQPVGIGPRAGDLGREGLFQSATFS